MSFQELSARSFSRDPRRRAKLGLVSGLAKTSCAFQAFEARCPPRWASTSGKALPVAPEGPA